MLEILQQFQTYLPKTTDDKFDPQLFTGDQLTVERAVNVIASVSNGFTPEDRLEGFNLQIGDWHAAVKILTVSYLLSKKPMNSPQSPKLFTPIFVSRIGIKYMLKVTYWTNYRHKLTLL